MTCIHDNEVNKIAEFNFLHGIINPTKITKNRHCSSIIHECINTRKGRENFNNFRILLESGWSSTIIMGSLVGKN